MKEKVKQLKELRSVLVGIQRYNIANGINKSRYVAYKLSYIDTVIEYLYTGINTKALGRIDGKSHLYNEAGTKMVTHLLIEDLKSKDIARHVRLVNKIAFNDHYAVVAFREQPIRLGYRNNNTNAVDAYNLYYAMLKDSSLTARIRELLSK